MIIIAGYVSWVYTYNLKNKSTDSNTQVVKQDFSHDGTYTIDGQKVTLINGFSEVPITPGSTSKIVTKYFGNDLIHDLNEDGKEDKVFIVTQNTGGSGTFYYVVALLDTVQGPVGSSAVLLGDRIAPQTITIDEKGTTNGTDRKNVIVVNYADRKIGENFSIAPSIGKSIWLKLDPKTMQFGEVAQNFEGESNSNNLTLIMKKWEWVKTIYSDNKLVAPVKQGKFSITFKSDNTFSATTDCNSIGGDYTTKDNSINFSKMISTQMYCEGSQETDFTKMLNETQNYLFDSKGELVLTMKFDSGSIFFK